MRTNDRFVLSKESCTSTTGSVPCKPLSLVSPRPEPRSYLNFSSRFVSAACVTLLGITSKNFSNLSLYIALCAGALIAPIVIIGDQLPDTKPHSARRLRDHTDHAFAVPDGSRPALPAPSDNNSNQVVDGEERVRQEVKSPAGQGPAASREDATSGRGGPEVGGLGLSSGAESSSAERGRVQLQEGPDGTSVVAGEVASAGEVEMVASTQLPREPTSDDGPATGENGRGPQIGGGTGEVAAEESAAEESVRLVVEEDEGIVEERTEGENR